MRYTPLTWYEQEYEHYEAHFVDFYLNTNFTSWLVEGWATKSAARQCEQSTRAPKTYQISAFQLA
jgi:hypothetical protein